MAILVHAARATRHWIRAGVHRGDRMYHVLSDIPGGEGSAELRAFVVQYGLRPEWVQYAGTYREHYDAREPEGLAMLRGGARLATNREVGALLAAKRAAASSAEDEILHFQRRLSETIRWCARKGRSSDPAIGLRTPMLRPSLLTFNGDDGYSSGTPYERHAVVEALASARNELLRTEHAAMLLALNEDYADAHPNWIGGKLLVFDPEHSLSDGAAWVATTGFFDGNNAPPWDTWIHYVTGPENEGQHPFNSYLISWVPPEFIESVATGLEVNPEECILWATELDRPFLRQLRDANLLF